MLIWPERIRVCVSTVKNMFVLGFAVGVDLGFAAIAVVIYCFTETSCAAVGFTFGVVLLNRCI